MSERGEQTRPGQPGPRRRAPRGSGEQLRGQIIEAAKGLLTEKNDANAVSIRAVADIVGVTPPSIYLHFADKEALLQAVVADVFGELHDRLSEAGAEQPLERLCQQGLAYVRFALDAPEHYRLATMATGGEFGDVDSVLATAAFAHLSETITECMAAGVFAEGDPTPIALDLWATAHGIASLLITKPYLPWGDPMETAYRVLGAAAQGRSVDQYLGSPTPTEFTEWRTALPPTS